MKSYSKHILELGKWFSEYTTWPTSMRTEFSYITPCRHLVLRSLYVVCNLSTWVTKWGRDKQIPGALWPTSFAESMSLQIVERLCFKKRKVEDNSRRLPMLTTSLHCMPIYSHVHPHTHMNRYV